MKKSIFLLFAFLMTSIAYANGYADDYYAKNFQSPSKILSVWENVESRLMMDYIAHVNSI